LESDPIYQVLSFWLGPEPGKSRAEWFRKDEAFDEEIRRRFGDLHASAARRELEAWRASPEPLLALVIVLDQFSRNLYRGDPRAFAQDEHARECAVQAARSPVPRRCCSSGPGAVTTPRLGTC
jgi:uncharacterized protein (DUF924 family)